MKRGLIYLATILFSIGIADAAVRDDKAVSRAPQKQTTVRTSVTQRATPSTTVATARTTKNTVARGATSTRANASTARTASSTHARAATTARSATGTNRATSVARSGIRPARATVSLNVAQSNTFGTGYNTCREAYFTCMDQFCGTANDTYRRCVCSSKLQEIKSRERALSQATDQLADFKNLNLYVIDKTGAEVGAMITASTGEYTQANIRDTSDSAKQLTGISDILNKTKTQSLSTQGSLDIAGDINSIWATTDLTGGTNIANLTGEALYNAVHAQCSELVADKCPSETTQTMVVSAYGMYIENDCSALINSLDKKLTTANSVIRETEREMNLARLDTYNAHNSTAINDCIAKVRQNITADTACGTDYVHCLDITGRYLTYETGEPIYSPNFYQLESLTSLSGDVLTNQTNRMIVATLNAKRIFAEKSLDTCRDLADEVWDEFMRQAISEIYQGQHDRIRQVKNECLDVVNACYDEQSQQLKDFSNVKEQLLIGSRLELSEQLCQEKLDACSNLYGGGPQGMSALLTAMHNIVDQQIGKQCLVTLQEYTTQLCAIPSNDTIHSFPYGCRVYNPGDMQYATIAQCNLSAAISKANGGVDGTTTSYEERKYTCDTSGAKRPTKKYTSCKDGYYMKNPNGTAATSTAEAQPGNACLPCPCDKEYCKGGIKNCPATSSLCGNYVGSLYHRIARYALQACIRPSESQQGAIPATVLQDINVVIDEIRIKMAKSLSDECDRLGGSWVNAAWVDTKSDKGCCANNICVATNNASTADGCHDITGQVLFKEFYSETSANTDWGFCSEPATTEEPKCTANTDCKNGEICNTETGKCEQPECTAETANTDCKNDEICNTETGKCEPNTTSS